MKAQKCWKGVFSSPFLTLSLLSGLVCFPSLSLLPGLPPQPSWRLPRMPWGFSACGFVAGGEAPLGTPAVLWGRLPPWPWPSLPPTWSFWVAGDGVLVRGDGVLGAFALALASVCVSVCCGCVALSACLCFFGGGVACVLRFGVCYCALLLRLPLRGRLLPRARSPICLRLPFVPLSFCACGAAVLSFFAASCCGRACVPLCLGRVLPLFPFLSPFLSPLSSPSPSCLLGPELPLEPVKAPGVAFNHSIDLAEWKKQFKVPFSSNCANKISGPFSL